MRNYFKGVSYTILSGLIYGLMPLAVTYITAHGGTSLSSCFFRCLFCLPFGLLLLLLLPKGQRGLHGPERKRMAVAALLFTAVISLLYTSYALVGTGVATTLHYCYPAFTLLGCAVFYKERVRPLSAVCVLLTLVGVFLCYSPEQGGSLLGMLVAFASGAFYAFYMIYLSKSGLDKLPPYKYVFYLHLFMVLPVALLALVFGALPVQLTPGAWLVQLLLALGIPLGAVALFTLGVRYIGPQRVSILSTFEPLTAIAVGLLVLHEPCTPKVLAGMALILVAVVVLTLGDRKQAEAAPAE